MNFQLKTKEELIDELQKLQRSYDSLMISFETVVKDRERTESIEQFSLNNFRNLADAIHDGILIAPANGQHIYANRQACELLGYSPEEILQTKQKDLADPETYPLLRQRLQDRIAGLPGPDIYETTLRRKDGTTFFADVNGTKIQWYGQDCYMVLFRDATDRKKTEKSLRDSEKKWRELVQTLPDYIALYDCDGKYLFLNHFADGFSIKDIEGKTYSDFMTVDSKLMYDRAFEVAKQTNTTQYFEYIAYGDNKSLRNYESYFVPICENGEFANIMVIARDITDRKQVERNLQDSEQKYRNLVENSLVGVLKSKVNGEIIYVNDAIVSMLEFDSREELIAAGAFMRYKYPSQREEFVKILKRDGLVREFEANILTKRGNERVFLYSLVLNGDTIDGTLIDITDRKQIERKVIENQQFLKTITSEVLEVIFALNAQGIFTFSEGKGLAKLGLQPGQVVGISVFDFYRDFPEIISSLKEAFNGRVVKTEGLEVGNLKYDTTFQPTFDESGQVTSIVGLAIEVTEAKNAEKALREAHESLGKKNEQLIKLNAEKDKFFSIIAHDLKTPFNGILGFSEMMIEHLKEKNFEQVGKYAEIILKSSNRAMDLLLNLMEWAQSHIGRMEFNPEYFDINDLIEDVEALFDNIARQKSILIANSSPLHSCIYADKAMISTVLRNLISNAIKFTKPGGKIIISVVVNPGETVVGVSDNGIGISPLNLQRLFRIDENYSTFGTQNEKGTGLGLILCKEFIEKHGGNIWVESTENAGSSFFFTLPALQVKSNSKTVNDSDYDPRGEIRSEVANKGLKVLIVDDDEISGFFLSKLVQTSCKEILIAKDGLEAVDHHRANSDIDLILMDIKMPKMDGFEATRQIRKSDNKVIIFAQTSFSSSSDRDSSIEAGCNEHISKPVKREVLMELINKYLG